MLEPAANIKTLLIEEGCSPINCFHGVIAKRSVCQQLKSSVRNIMTTLIPTLWRLSKLIFDFYDLSRSIERLSNTGFSFSHSKAF